MTSSCNEQVARAAAEADAQDLFYRYGENPDVPILSAEFIESRDYFLFFKRADICTTPGQFMLRGAYLVMTSDYSVHMVGDPREHEGDPAKAFDAINTVVAWYAKHGKKQKN